MSNTGIVRVTGKGQIKIKAWHDKDHYDVGEDLPPEYSEPLRHFFKAQNVNPRKIEKTFGIKVCRPFAQRQIE